ncbi:MAG: hypothetical protein U9N73_02270 [Candidatus Auribacterota bacterium]|nr:hypothetical protein [Candidatus Auribacterota bacterium]
MAIILLGGVFLLVIPVGLSNPIKLWSNGDYRQMGKVEVTGIPGRDYYRQDGPWIYWYRNGQTRKKGSFTEGTESDWWTYWYHNGIRRKEGSYNRAGKENGPWKYWYNNGLEEQEGAYKNGLPDGHWISYYNQVKNSLRWEGDFIVGKKDGSWVYRYKNGRKKKSGEYGNGLETGSWKYWYDDGEIKSEGLYSNGLETGEWIYWDKTGEAEKRQVKKWRYSYTEILPSKKPRVIGSLSQALMGHWLSEKALANFQRSQKEPEDINHVYLSKKGNFLEVLDGGFIAGIYTIEKEDPVKKTIQFRITRSNGKGAVLFAIFSEDYRKLAGMYYLVNFLRGSRGRTTNYFFMSYAGTDPGPELK